MDNSNNTYWYHIIYLYYRGHRNSPKPGGRSAGLGGVPPTIPERDYNSPPSASGAAETDADQGPS